MTVCVSLLCPSVAIVSLPSFFSSLPFLGVVGPDPGTPSVRLVLLLRCTCLGREGDAPDGGLYFIVEGRVDVLVGGWDSKGGDGAPTSPGSGARSRPHHANTRYLCKHRRGSEESHPNNPRKQERKHAIRGGSQQDFE